MGEQGTPQRVPVLGYGRPGRPEHLRRWRRIGLVLLVLLALGWLGIDLVAPYWNQAKHLRHQYRIAHQTLPPDTVIYTEDPARIASLQNRPDYRSKQATWGSQYNPQLPNAWERVYSTDGFETFDPASRPTVTGCQVNDTFGWRRTSAGGIEWIVLLDQVNPYMTTGGRRLVCYTQNSIKPVGWTPGSRGASVSTMSRQILLEPTDILTLLAPAPDPKDASRVNIKYELNGTPGIIDATVMNNGHVQFEVRTGPARIVPWNWVDQQNGQAAPSSGRAGK